jgi:hypothetical protein
MLKGVWRYSQVVIENRNKNRDEPQKQSLGLGKGALIPRTV